MRILSKRLARVLLRTSIAECLLPGHRPVGITSGFFQTQSLEMSRVAQDLVTREGGEAGRNGTVRQGLRRAGEVESLVEHLQAADLATNLFQQDFIDGVLAGAAGVPSGTTSVSGDQFVPSPTGPKSGYNFGVKFTTPTSTTTTC